MPRMPVHSFAAANAEALAKLRNDPLQFQITANSDPVTVNYRLDFITFVREIMFKPDAVVDEAGRRKTEDVRPLVDCIHDCLIPDDRERFLAIIAKSKNASDDGDFIAAETLVDARQQLLEYFRGEIPLPDSGSSADSPSNDGLSSTESSSNEPSEPAAVEPTAAAVKLIQE